MQDAHLTQDQFNVTLRESLLSLFQNTIQRNMQELNSHYFAHNLIKNYYKPGHTVSSFVTHPEWQQEYWTTHCKSDNLSHKIHQIAEIEGFAISSWSFIDPDSEIMKRRKLVCDLDDGVHFTFKHEDGLLENYAFGWKRVKSNPMDFEKIFKLSEIVDDFRNKHLKLFYEPTPHFSDEIQ